MEAGRGERRVEDLRDAIVSIAIGVRTLARRIRVYTRARGDREEREGVSARERARARRSRRRVEDNWKNSEEI